MAELEIEAGKAIASNPEAEIAGLSGDTAKGPTVPELQSTKVAGSTNQSSKAADPKHRSTKGPSTKNQSNGAVEPEDGPNETTNLAANLANVLSRTSPNSLPADLQRIWLSATGLIGAIVPAVIAPELAPLLAAFTQARKNLAADIAHETRLNQVSETAHRPADDGPIASDEADDLAVSRLLDELAEDEQQTLPPSADLPPLQTDPQQTLIVSVVRSAFEARPETLKQLLGSAPCIVFEVPAGIDVKAVARVLPVLLYGPDALTIGLDELLSTRVKPRCFVHWIAEPIDNYNGRSNGLLNSIRSNLLRAADFGVPVLVVKAADLALLEPIASVFSAAVNLPLLTTTMVDVVIGLYANARLANTGLANAGLADTNLVDAKVVTGLATGTVDSSHDAALDAAQHAALDADTRDLAAVGSFAIGAMIQRGSGIADTIERIKNKLAPHAKARIELDAEQEAERDSEDGAEASGTAGSGGTLKITKLENGKTVPVNPSVDKAIGGKAAGVKSGAYDNDANDPNVPRLEDLAGYGPAGVWGLELAKDIADYRNGTIGWSEIDRGLVLAGPPGVGKTIFARALAKTAGVAFIASSFTKWESHKGGHHGDVIKTMAEHFDEARKCAPCIMLIDEIDSIPNRERLDDHSRAWWTSMVNGLLEQLDGSLARDGVIVIGACNDASQLDPALVRSGRLEKIIHIPYPSTADLAKIFRFHLKDELPGFDPIVIAEGLSGFTGADVEAAVRSARRKARREKRELAENDLDDAMFGEETISDTQLWRTAIHEAGHAIAATALNLEPVDFISIRTRGQTGGFVRLGSSNTAQSPDPLTRRSVLAYVAQTLAGRAAETIIFGTPDTGSGGSKSSDLAIATQLLGQTNSQHGLGRDGNLVWHPPLAPAKPWPANIAASITLDLSEQQSRAEAIITANTALVTELAETLMATKTMNGDVFASTFAGRVRKDPDKDQVAAI